MHSSISSEISLLEGEPYLGWETQCFFNCTDEFLITFQQRVMHPTVSLECHPQVSLGDPSLLLGQGAPLSTITDAYLAHVTLHGM